MCFRYKSNARFGNPHVPKRNVSKPLRWKIFLAIIAALSAQNIWIFNQHYFNGYAFPWDFLGPYYALPYYWIQALQQGVDIAWIPFQGMGYPIYLNTQSGLFYPPFWIFVISNQKYTVEAAVLMQGLHVLFGASGATLCARVCGMSWRKSLLVGVAYQGFGAFYSNASHPDIVRTYALLPWCCTPILGSWKNKTILLQASILSLPLWVYALWTGGYPGGTIATLFILGTTLLARLLLDPINRNIGTYIILALISGCLLAGVSLVPAALGASEINRVAEIGELAYDYLVPKDIFALIYPINNTQFAHDVTMRSIFVGLPVIGLLIIGLKKIKQWNPWIVFSLLLALVMASGLLHKHIIHLFAPLGYSRFVFSDYRGFIGLSIILLSIQHGTSDFDTAKSRSYIWCTILLLLITAGNYALQLNTPSSKITFELLMVMFFITVVTIEIIKYQLKNLLIPFLILIIMADWARVNWKESYFNFPNGTAWVEATISNHENKNVTSLPVRNDKTCRPARIHIPESEPSNTPWRGYLTGQYMTEDYSGPMKFARQQQIVTSPKLLNFAQEPWMAVAIESNLAPNDVRLMESHIAPVTCTDYGTTQIIYEVNLPTPQLVVENELFWKGWEANIIDATGTHTKTLIPVNVQGFRGWNLPKGKYNLISKFETPNKWIGIWISFAGFLGWICLAILIFISSRRKSI